MNMPDTIDLFHTIAQNDLEQVKESLNDNSILHDVALEIAAKTNPSIIKHLVRQKKNFTNDEYDNALKIAVTLGDLETIKYLITRGAQISGILLSVAADNGHLEVVKYLIGCGSNSQIELSLAIVKACSDDKLPIMKYLISCGANIHVFDERCLHNAVQQKSFETIKFLLLQGADFTQLTCEEMDRIRGASSEIDNLLTVAEILNQ